MNAIDTLITMANLRGSLDVRCQFQGDWALDHAPESLGVAPYHIVLSGTCHAELSGGQRVTLEEGDILLLPGGATHLLRSQGASGSAPVYERIVARHPLPGGITKPGQPSSITLSQASSWLPRRHTTLQPTSRSRPRTTSTTSREHRPRST